MLRFDHERGQKTLCEVTIQIRPNSPANIPRRGAIVATNLIFSDVCLAHLVESGSSYAKVGAFCAYSTDRGRAW
jgi:hypothetical protein